MNDLFLKLGCLIIVFFSSGAGSFVLFTLDKIALQMTKQLDHMLRSDVGASSLALYAKEQLNLQSLAQQHVHILLILV
jgi:hypothetical protein